MSTRTRTRTVALSRNAWLGRCVSIWLSLAFGTFMYAPRAHGEELVCNHPQLRIEPAAPARWRPALADLCDTLPQLRDVDTGARLQLTATQDEIVVHVTLADGREAVRHVRSSEALRDTVEALMLKPSSPLPALTPEPTPRPAAVAAEPTHSLSLVLGGALTGRVARAPTYLSWGFELHAGVQLAAWLLALNVRWDALSRATSSLEADAVGAGFKVTRHMLVTGFTTWSLGGEAAFLVQTQSGEVRGATRPRSAADLRVGLLSQLILGHSALRGLVAASIELSPLRLRRSMSIYEPLPSWSVGLALGCQWESP